MAFALPVIAAAASVIGAGTAAYSSYSQAKEAKRARKAQEQAQDKVRKEQIRAQELAMSRSRESVQTGFGVNNTNVLGSRIGGSGISTMLGGGGVL